MASTGAKFFIERSTMRDFIVDLQDELLRADQITKEERGLVEAYATTPFKSYRHTKFAKSDLQNQLRYLTQENKILLGLVAQCGLSNEASLIKYSDSLKKFKRISGELRGSVAALDNRANREQLDEVAAFINDLFLFEEEKRARKAKFYSSPSVGEVTMIKRFNSVTIRFNTKRKAEDQVDNSAKRRKSEEENKCVNPPAFDTKPNSPAPIPEIVQEPAKTDKKLLDKAEALKQLSTPLHELLFELEVDVEGKKVVKTTKTKSRVSQLREYFISLCKHAERHGSPIHPHVRNISLPSPPEISITTTNGKSYVWMTEIEYKNYSYGDSLRLCANTRGKIFQPDSQVQWDIKNRWWLDPKGKRIEAGQQTVMGSDSTKAYRLAKMTTDIASEITASKMKNVAMIKALQPYFAKKRVKRTKKQKELDKIVRLADPLTSIPHHMRSNMVDLRPQRKEMEQRSQMMKYLEEMKKDLAEILEGDVEEHWSEIKDFKSQIKRFERRTDQAAVGTGCRKGNFVMGRLIDYSLGQEKTDSMGTKTLELRGSSCLKTECLNMREILEEERTQLPGSLKDLMIQE